MTDQPAVHCWEDGPRKGENEPYGSLGTGSSCMLPDGHDGPHEFTWDDEIIITFAEESSDG